MICYRFLSNDVSVIQQITSCHKSHMTHMCNNTFIEIIFILKVIKPILKGHMINRILYSSSFHVKFFKLAETRFIIFI